MKSKKILLVANTDWYLYNFRLALAKSLKDQGAEVVFVAPKGKFSSELQDQGFRFIEWNVGRRTISPVMEINSIFKLKRIYSIEKPNLVHHFTIKPVLYGSISSKITKVPAVVNSITGLGYIFQKRGKIGKLLRHLIIKFYKYSFSKLNLKVIFENSHNQSFFIENNIVQKNNSTIIQGAGVDTSLFRPSPEPNNDEPLVIFPARMLYDKGVDNLVEASKILKSKLKVHIACVGDIDEGNPTAVDENTIKHWEEIGAIEWWGFQEDMATVFSKCNIVTLPSLGEGLPTALIEAAACERPIVATDVPGCNDIVQNGVNGLLVPPGQPELLANAIEILIRNPEKRRRMGQAGRKLVLEKFSVQIVNQKSAAVYKRLMAE